MRVLIVDDEQAFAEPLAQRLELRGIEAAVAGDAETALDMLSRQEWDLVFLDVCLPGMDGVSLLKLLQEHEPRPDVVMLSGATEMSQAVKAMRRGALNWLAKPVSLDAVLEECRKARERADARRQARRLAEEARLRSLGRIAEGVAHEVNNPLNIIVQAAGLMSDSLDSPEAGALPDIEDLRESLRTIVTQSMRVREITRKLLMAGVGLDPRSAPMDVRAVVSRVLTLLQGRMDSLKVACRLHFPPEWGEDGPRPLGSALELEQICLHLVENALDAMPEGGTLDIGARLLPADADGTAWYELWVADNGTGIDDDIMPHIFEPFFTTHRQAGRGAGLGLSVATGLAHGRGGRITAANRPEGGALFRLLLPLPAAGGRNEDTP
ncbi:response regulator [Desulfovibrio piger]|uniref:hybrid sensor histidine kinase/response regulator n=1 Tax=Desulfovibrio piger TaxID=901 RepID=UPI00307EF63A